MYEHFCRIMEQAHDEVMATGHFTYEDDFYRVRYNARTREFEAEYIGPPLGGTDR